MMNFHEFMSQLARTRRVVRNERFGAAGPARSSAHPHLAHTRARAPLTSHETRLLRTSPFGSGLAGCVLGTSH